MSSPEKAVVTPEGRKVLAQDLPQYERSVYPARVRKFKKEKKEFDTAKSQYEKDLAAYEKEKAEFERKEKEAQKKYEKELAEFEKKFKSDYGISYDEYQRRTEILESKKEKYSSDIEKIERQKKERLAELHEAYWGPGGLRSQGMDRSQYNINRSRLEKSFDSQIEKIKSGAKRDIQRTEFSTIYPNVTLGGTWFRDWQKNVELKGSGVGTLVQEYEQELKRREGQAAEARSQSIRKMLGEAATLQKEYQTDKTAYANQIGEIKSKAEQIKAPDPLSVRKVRRDVLPGETVKDTKQRYKNPDALIMQRPTKEFTKRTSAVKPTPDVITGKPAEKSRRPLTGVKTGSFIYGDYFLEGDPRARVKGMFRTPDVSPEPPQTAYLYKGKTVKEPSAKELLKFQLQLKTRTAPSPAIYEGILEEKGLPVTPLARQIIQEYSARRATKEGIKTARGPKPTYTDPKTGETFSAETMLGSKKIAQALGYKIPEQTKQYEFKGQTIADPSAIALLEFQSRVKTPTLLSPSIYKGILEEKGLPYTPQARQVIDTFSSDQPRIELSRAGGPKGVITDPKTGDRFDLKKMKGDRKIAKGLGIAVDERPLSSTGQRFEFYLGEIEKQQRKYAKYGDEPGQLLHYGLEFPKDLLAGGAYLENIMREGAAFITGKPSPTRPIQIPETSFGVFTDELIKTKQPIAAGFAVKRYEQEFGRGSSAGAIAALAVPVPFGEKIGAVGKPFQKIYEKTKIAKIANRLQQTKEKITISRRGKIVEKIASERAGEGVFGIRREGKDLFIIERGVEELRPRISGKSQQPEIIGFSKYEPGKPPKPIFAKEPKKQVVPSPEEPAKVPITLVEFRGKASKVTDVFLPEGKIPPTKPEIIGFTKVKPKQPKFLGVFPKRPIFQFEDVARKYKMDRYKPVYSRSERVLIASPDPEFTRTAKTLKMTEVAKGLFEKEKPGRRFMEEIAGLEKQKQIRLTAIEKSAPLEAIIKPKSKPGLFEFVGERARIGRVYETAGAGIGKGEPARLKSGEWMLFGSRDLERLMSRAGLIESRKLSPPKTPFDTSIFKTVSGGAGGAGKAAVFSEQTKQQIIQSRTTKPDTPKPITRQTDIKRITTPQKYDTSSLEYTTVRYPPSVATPSFLASEVIPMSILKPVQISSNLERLKSDIETQTLTKQKVQAAQAGRYKLDTSLAQRTKPKREDIPALKIREATVLKTSGIQAPKLRQPQRLKERQLEVLKQEPVAPVPQRGRGRGTRRSPIVLRTKEPERKKRTKEKENFLFGFLGNVPEGQVSGIFKRQEITYGAKRIQKLSLGDVRVTKGLKRATKRKTTWYEGKKSDPFGFKNEAKKIQKRAKKKGVSFW